MKFRFIGDPRNNFSGPDRFEKFGLQFSRTDWTEVTDKSLIAKLLNSSHYENGGAFAEPAHDEREALIADAQSLGVDVDRRWSNATISAKIQQALGA